MRNKLEHIAQIDAYLDGEMSSEELRLFEEELDNNAVLKEEVLFQKEANNLLIIGELHSLEKQVKNYNYKPNNKNTINYKNGAISLAGLLLLAGLSIFVLNNTNTQSLGVAKKVTLTRTPVQQKLPTKEIEKEKGVEPLKVETKPSVQYKEKIVVDTLKKKQEVPVTTDTLQVEKELTLHQKDSVLTEAAQIKVIEPKVSNVEKPTLTKINPTIEKPAVIEPEKEVFTEPEEQPNYDLAFSPSRGQRIIWPVEEGFEGKIVLYNTNGKLLLEQQFNGYQSLEWDGISQQGNVITFGVYPFIIYPSNRKPIQGSVTVVE